MVPVCLSMVRIIFREFVSSRMISPPDSRVPLSGSKATISEA